MRIGLLTSNQPRHLALARRLAAVAEELFVLQECNTIAPGEVEDFFRRSPVMQRYFAQVLRAEAEVFAPVGFHPANVRSLAVKHGDANRLPLATLAPLLESDVIVVFGSSWLRGALVDRLIEKRALNLHMGISPQYRGSSCNFWALYDGRSEYVGGTLHYLGKGLDSGPIIAHALPDAGDGEPFALGMRAVAATHELLGRLLEGGGLFDLAPVEQDRAAELRYTRNADFDDAVAARYLADPPDPATVASRLAARRPGDFVRPFFLGTP